MYSKHLQKVLLKYRFLLTYNIQDFLDCLISNLIENREIIFYKGGSIIPVGSKAKFTRKKYMIIRFADNFIPICDFSEFNQNNNVFSFNGVILKFNFELFEVEVISNENKLVSLYLLDNVVL